MLKRLKELFTIQPSMMMRLPVESVTSLEEYQEHVSTHTAIYQQRWKKELALCASGTEFETSGFCFSCQAIVLFKTDFLYSTATINGQAIPNWRERVTCPRCQMNNRTRASIQLLAETLEAKKESKIYIAEQVTQLYAALKQRYPALVGSEYLGGKVAFGMTDERGLRNESITKLTFQDNAFDYILNFDVLEHVPDVSAGLHEIYRCLAPNGMLLLSVPFMSAEQTTSIRATISSNGEIEHLKPAYYHGDPITDAGCLCFQDFGWDLLEQMRSIGFDDVKMLLYWSDYLGYYGVEQMMITARKKDSLK